MNRIIRQRMAARKRRLARRLDKHNYPEDLSQPVLGSANVQYELAGRGTGTAYGGIGLMQELVRTLGLAEAIDQRLHLFKMHLPYHESDHVLNLAYNALCAGTCLEDLELRRQDEAYLNLLGAERIPDPTTAGDFCRRFQRPHLTALQQAYDVARRKVWSEQPAEFFAEARIEADGTLVKTGSECKQGIDINYQGEWGYHPLLLTLANTGEVLRLVNRSGNRPSHEGAPALFDECIALCRAAGFQKILLRGDTDFSQTQHLDRWHQQGDVRFVFGLDLTAGQHGEADDLPQSAWKSLKRPPKYQAQGPPRARPQRVKQQIVEERQFKDIRLVDEEVAERPYRPVACQTTYRLVIVRRNLSVHEPKQGRIFADYRYFLYLTNDGDRTPEEIVFSANPGAPGLPAGECTRAARGSSRFARAGRQSALQRSLSRRAGNGAGLEPQGLAGALPAGEISGAEAAAEGEQARGEEASAVGQATLARLGVSHVCQLLPADSSPGGERRPAGRGATVGLQHLATSFLPPGRQVYSTRPLLISGPAGVVRPTNRQASPKLQHLRCIRRHAQPRKETHACFTHNPPRLIPLRGPGRPAQSQNTTRSKLCTLI